MIENSYIDISYHINNKMAIYPNNPEVNLEKVSDISAGNKTNVTRICLGSHTGTHIDAPSHFLRDGLTIDQIPLDRLNGKAKVIDATNRNEIDVYFLRSLNIEKDDILLLKTDNSYCWSCDRILDDYVSLSYDAAEYLVQKKIKLVGVDYLSVERPKIKRSIGISVHKILLEKNVLICEGLNLKVAVEGDYDFLCFPLCIDGLDGCPVRAVLSQKIDRV